MRIRVRKGMQEWKGKTRKAMQEWKGKNGTSVDITLDDTGRTRSLVANLAERQIDEDGLVHAKFVLALPIVTDNKHPDG